MIDLSCALRGDRVRVVKNCDTERYPEMARFVGQIVTLREKVSGYCSAWYIYEDEGTCAIEGHNYGGWFWLGEYLEPVPEELEDKLASLELGELSELLFGEAM